MTGVISGIVDDLLVLEITRNETHGLREYEIFNASVLWHC